MTATMSIHNQQHNRKGVIIIGAVVIGVVLAAALSMWAIMSSHSTNPVAKPAPAAHTVAPATTPAPAKVVPPATAAPAHTVAPTTPVTTPTPPKPTTPVTPSFAGVPTGAVAAITSWENAEGGVGTWQLSSAQSSTANPAYVLFHLVAAPGHQSTFQPGYGFVLNTNGAWDVAAYGNNDVGCAAPGTTGPSMPTAVLAGFGLSCPPA